MVNRRPTNASRITGGEYFLISWRKSKPHRGINTARQSRNQNETSHHGDTEKAKATAKKSKVKTAKVKTSKQRTQRNFGAWRAVEKFKIVFRDTARI
jgi:hypothetical protein